MTRWPALNGLRSTALSVRRGVWGKAHGARSDYRWLARSTGFGHEYPRLGRQLNLGLEDRPASFPCWRALEGVYWAVAAYPSTAVDAAGRRGFLEKHALEWPAGGEPAAAGALVLLSAAGEDGPRPWSSQEEGWSDPGFSIVLSSPEADLEIGAEGLAERVEIGLRELRERVAGENRLAEVYADLLNDPMRDAGPALLRGLEAPLSPLALAALLLPLPRSLADRLSLAGWLPVSRCDLHDLGRRWDVVVPPPSLKVHACGEVGDHAWRMARAVFAGDPALLEEPTIAAKLALPMILATHQEAESRPGLLVDKLNRHSEPADPAGRGKAPEAPLELLKKKREWQRHSVLVALLVVLLLMLMFWR